MIKTINNKFNICFANVGPNLDGKIKMPMNKTFQSYLNGTHDNNFQINNINEDITLSIVDKLAPKTSGFDSIFSKSIKTIKVTLIKHIKLIINQVLTTGIFQIN